MEHKELKEQYLKYREMAQVIASSNNWPPGSYIKVQEHAPVQLMEDGAFVEAIIWVLKFNPRNIKCTCGGFEDGLHSKSCAIRANEGDGI